MTKFRKVGGRRGAGERARNTLADAGWAWPTFTGSTTLLVLLRFTLRDRLKKQVAAAIDRRPRSTRELLRVRRRQRIYNALNVFVLGICLASLVLHFAASDDWGAFQPRNAFATALIIALWIWLPLGLPLAGFFVKPRSSNKWSPEERERMLAEAACRECD